MTTDNKGAMTDEQILANFDEYCSRGDIDNSEIISHTRSLLASSILPEPVTTTPAHLDDAAIDRFAVAMKAKMATARAKGRSSWQTYAPVYLSSLLREHVEKGDPVDVANFCMMLHENSAAVRSLDILAAQPAQAAPLRVVSGAMTDEQLDNVFLEWNSHCFGDPLESHRRFARAILAAQPVQAVAWQSIPNLPEPFNDEFYGQQYSVPALLDDGEKILPQVARWSFLEDGWVGADYREGPNPSDYEWLNEKPVRWMALGVIAPVPAEGAVAAPSSGLEQAFSSTLTKRRDDLDLEVPTTYLDRFIAAMGFVCQKQPPKELCEKWLSHDSEDLQSWAVSNARIYWMTGIGAIEAAQHLADEPEEGRGHEGFTKDFVAPEPIHAATITHAATVTRRFGHAMLTPDGLSLNEGDKLYHLPKAKP